MIEDGAPLPGDAAVSRKGDLWTFGKPGGAKHRLLCGDSSSRADLERLLGGQRIHLVNSDPPYNVKVEPRSNNAIAAGLSSFAPQKQMHHQKFDHARNPNSKKTTEKMRPKDRPLANDFVTEGPHAGAMCFQFSVPGWNGIPDRQFGLLFEYAEEYLLFLDFVELTSAETPAVRAS